LKDLTEWTTPEKESATAIFDWEQTPKKWHLQESAALLQVEGQYIIAPLLQGYLLIHQQYAHERVLYERYAAALVGKSMAAQQSLFPVTLHLSPADANLLDEIRTDLNLLGYVIEPFGQHSFLVQGTPADLIQGNEKAAIEQLIDQYKHFSADVKFSRREKLIRSLSAIRAGTLLGQTEMRQLTEDLLRCITPNVTASGLPTFIEFTRDYLGRLFDSR
jgi:DNA mismatch repair protein MutL